MFKKVIVITFFLSFILGCTISQFDGEFPIEAEIIGISGTVVSIKYKIGGSEIYDDLNLEKKNAIRLEWQHKNIKNIELRVSMYGYSSNSPTKKTMLKYYYGSNLICEHYEFDYDTLESIAKENESSFSWKYKDGVDLSVIKKDKEKQKEKEEQGKKL